MDGKATLTEDASNGVRNEARHTTIRADLLAPALLTVYLSCVVEY